MLKQEIQTVLEKHNISEWEIIEADENHNVIVKTKEKPTHEFKRDMINAISSSMVMVLFEKTNKYSTRRKTSRRKVKLMLIKIINRQMYDEKEGPVAYGMATRIAEANNMSLGYFLEYYSGQTLQLRTNLLVSE